MVKYFPHSWENYQDPLRSVCMPANSLLMAGPLSGAVGIIFGVVRYAYKFVRSTPTTGLFMRTAAILGIPSYIFGAGQNFMKHREFQKRLSEKNVKIEKTPYVYNVGQIDLDDWIIRGGVAALALAAIRRRRFGVVGWKRYFGAKNLGMAGGYVSWLTFHEDELMIVMGEYERREREAELD